jgi:AcrR family transcriptional regulator
VTKPTTRERILGAAERVHQQEGLDAVSMRRIADEVGLTAMALYRHFRDKDALLDALVDAALARWEAYLSGVAAAASPVERIRGALSAYVGFALGEPHAFQLTYLVARPNAPSGAAAVDPPAQRMTASPAYRAIVAAAREGMDRGDLRPGDPEETMLLAWSAVHGLVVLHRAGRFGFDDARFRGVAGRAIGSLLQSMAAGR